MAAVGTVVGEGFTSAAGEAPIRVGEAEPVADRLLRRTQPDTELRGLQLLQVRDREVGLRRGLAMVIPILGPAAISRVGISTLGIPLRRRLLSPTASGIPLADLAETVVLRGRNRKLGPQATREGSTFSAGIVERGPTAQSALFRDKAAKSGRILPPLEIWFPSLNRFPPFTIRLTVRMALALGSGRIQRWLPLRVLPPDRHFRAVAYFQAV